MSVSDSGQAYGDALKWLLGRINYERSAEMPYGSSRMNLQRMRRLLQRLGHPESRLSVVHVAGTKGKGSTSAMIASMARSAGYRTGLFTSPHLDRIEERLAVDGRPCSVDEFVELAERLRPVVAGMDGVAEEPDGKGSTAAANSPPGGSPPDCGPTFFEITTAMALVLFERRGVDLAVLEVGLGGRLDSTNVCLPRVSVITSISFDHTRQLGYTLEAITREKAGILKDGVPVVSGVAGRGPRRVIHQIAGARGCRLLQLGQDFDFRYQPPHGIDLRDSDGSLDYIDRSGRAPEAQLGLRLKLAGRHQAANASVALAAIGELRRQGWEIPEWAARKGLADLSLAARIELLRRAPTVVVDAAHNAASAESLAQVLDESCVLKRRILVFATSNDKDIASMLRILGPRFEQILLTRFIDNPRAVSVADLAHTSAQTTTTPCLTCEDPTEAWRCVRRLASAQHLVVVAGSFFLAAEMRRRIAAEPIQPETLSPREAV